MIRAAVITISDKGAAGEREDRSGQVLAELIEKKGWSLVDAKVIPDEREEISVLLKEIADEGKADIIFTTGGTGFARRDVTPEATRMIIEKEVPGISEMIRAESAKITNRAYLSRGISGIRNQTLIINFPGSPKAVRESFEIIEPILEHGLEILMGKATECAR